MVSGAAPPGKNQNGGGSFAAAIVQSPVWLMTSTVDFTRNTWLVQEATRFDLFAFTPRPRWTGGHQISSAGVCATFFALIVMLSYIVFSTVDYATASPEISIIRNKNERMAYDMVPFAVRVSNPVQLMVPYSVRPMLTIDPSYFSITVKETSAKQAVDREYWHETAANTRLVPMGVCFRETALERRTFWSSSYCPSVRSGTCPGTTLCSPPSGLRLVNDCRTSDDCQRVEIRIGTCATLPVAEAFALDATEWNATTGLNVTLPSPDNSYSVPAGWQVKVERHPALHPSAAAATAGLVLLRPVPNDTATAPEPYGILCDDYVDHNAAQVLCHAAGLPWQHAQVLRVGHRHRQLCNASQDECHFYADDLVCPPPVAAAIGGALTPVNVSNCSLRFHPRGVRTEHCGAAEAVAVRCPAAAPAWQTRLANTTTANGRNDRIGLLLVRADPDDEWSTVCRANFGPAEAVAACRAVGIDVTSAQVLQPGLYGVGATLTHRYYLQQSECGRNSSGNATAAPDDADARSLHECARLGYSETFAKACYREDVTLDCTMFRHETPWEFHLADPLTGARLPPTATRGLLQLRPSNSSAWGAACVMDFNGEAAGAACRSLGFPVQSARVVRGIRWNSSLFVAPGSIVVSNVFCRPGQYLDQCQHDFHPEGTGAADRPYDCGRFGANYAHDLSQRRMYTYAVVDCSTECAAPGDIAEVLRNTHVEVALNLTTRDHAIDVVSQRLFLSDAFWLLKTFYLNVHDFVVEPQWPQRWSPEAFMGLRYDEQGYALSRLWRDGDDTAGAGITLATVVVQMGNYVVEERWKWEQIPDLVGGWEAFCSFTFLFFGIVFARINEAKFYRHHPQWDYVNDEFVRVPPGEDVDTAWDDAVSAASEGPASSSAGSAGAAAAASSAEPLLQLEPAPPPSQQHRGAGQREPRGSMLVRVRRRGASTAGRPHDDDGGSVLHAAIGVTTARDEIACSEPQRRHDDEEELI